jgi:perosamine synthetase
MTKLIDPHEFTERIRSVVGHDKFVGLHLPDISDLEHRYVTECLDSTFVSSVGPFVTRFEEDVASFTGARHAVAVSNGTSALQVALVLAGVQHGDEVIVPALSFVATANAVAHAGATPYFIDSDWTTMGMSPKALKDAISSLEQRASGWHNPLTGRKVSAIVPMHTLGHPAQIEELTMIAEEARIPLVEDAAESLGSYVGRRHTGTFGSLGILSFNGNKTITTGGGGMILTNDDELGRRAKHITTTAKLAHPWHFAHDETAWNYRLPNLNAALGVAQLERLPQFLSEKRIIANDYMSAFSGAEGITFITEPEGTTSNYWLCSVALSPGRESELEKFLEVANDAGLQCRPLWNLLNTLPMYSNSPAGPLDNARAMQKLTISIPSSPAIARGKNGESR